MTEDQAIHAGALAQTRKYLRKASKEARPAELHAFIDGKMAKITLDMQATRSVFDALDFHLSDRLHTLGVAEV